MLLLHREEQEHAFSAAKQDIFPATVRKSAGGDQRHVASGHRGAQARRFPPIDGRLMLPDETVVANHMKSVAGPAMALQMRARHPNSMLAASRLHWLAK